MSEDLEEKHVDRNVPLVEVLYIVSPHSSGVRQLHIAALLSYIYEKLLIINN